MTLDPDYGIRLLLPNTRDLSNTLGTAGYGIDEKRPEKNS